MLNFANNDREVKIITTFVKNTLFDFFIRKRANKKGKKQAVVRDNTTPARLKIKEYPAPRKK